MKILLTFSTIISVSAIIERVIDIENNTFCDFWCGRGHTACRLAPCYLSFSQCGDKAKILFLNDEDRETILDAHNLLRNDVATGGTSGGTATDMAALSYSIEIEFVAQCWANFCSLSHDKCNSVTDYLDCGQNIINFKNIKKNPSAKYYLLQTVRVWKEEGKKFLAKGPQYINKYVFEDMWANYSQMIWAETKLMGCGRVAYEGHLLIVCNYAPIGNMERLPVFKTGSSPCSECREGSCNSKYKGLCGEALILKNWTPPFRMGAFKNRLSYFFEATFPIFLLVYMKILLVA